MRTAILLSTLFLFSTINFNGQKRNRQSIKIDINKEYQTIHSFGASDAWRCQFVGANWHKEKKEQMARWLFSKELDENGNPLGIGLSLWRFNIGTGSMEQGDSSGIVNPWRKSECFLNADGTYDWNKQSGQRWFLEQAKKYNVEYSLAFTNSPPVHFTINGKAFSSQGRTRMNLRDDKMSDYALFLTNVCKHFEEIGLGFNYLSPVNEPQWDWSNPTQEGTPASNEDMFLLTHYLNNELQKQQVQTRIALGEAGEYNFLYQREIKHPGVSDQFQTFWSPSGPLFLGQFSTVEPLFSGHSYFSTWPVAKLIGERQAVRQSLDKINPDIDFWQSEFCILEKNSDIDGGNMRDLGIQTALYVARVIHFDLILTNATSWQWWTAITQCNYKDGLIYLDNGNNGIDSHQHLDNDSLKHDGYYHDSKTMWAFGNYSRFVRPGMIRIETALFGSQGETDEAQALMISAFKNPNKKEVVLVAVNYSNKEQLLDMENKKYFYKKVRSYTTSETSNLQYNSEHINTLSVPAKSVKTFILKYGSDFTK